MADHPIIFNGPMIRALIEGRKTQTRRVVKAPTTSGSFVVSCQSDGVPELNFGLDDCKANGDLRWHRCPYGQPGDLLWVRENFAAWWVTATGKRSHVMGYRADVDDPDWDGFGCDDPWWLDARWEPSIHMPRAFSRLTLRITDVRVQRLHEISEADALAEGITLPPGPGYGPVVRSTFAVLWDAINGHGSFDSSPWVWALTFDVIPRNIDAVLRELANAPELTHTT